MTCFYRTALTDKCMHHYSPTKYGGFLGVILIVELACATSMYAYKDRLANGFDKGLNDSMVKYAADDIAIVTDFDLMQGKVSRLPVECNFL